MAEEQKMLTVTETANGENTTYTFKEITAGKTVSEFLDDINSSFNYLRISDSQKQKRIIASSEDISKIEGSDGDILIIYEEPESTTQQ